MNKNTPIHKDWFMVGFTTGVAASVIKSLVNLALDKVGVPTVLYTSMASAAVLGRRARFGGLDKNPPKTSGEWTVGMAADALLGGIYGAGLSYMLVKMPSGFEVVKGAVAGGAIWLTTMAGGQMLNLANIRGAKPKQMATLLATSMLFGAIEGLVIGRYSSSLVEQSHPLLVKPVTNRQFHRGRLGRDPAMAR